MRWTPIRTGLVGAVLTGALVTWFVFDAEDKRSSVSEPDGQPTEVASVRTERQTDAPLESVDQPVFEPVPIGGAVPSSSSATEDPAAAPAPGEPEPLSEPVPLTPLVQEDSVVDWEAAEQHPHLDMERLSEEQRTRVSRSPVPVLLPDHGELLEAAFLMNGTGWYAADMDDEEHTVHVTGSSQHMKVPGSEWAGPPEFGDHELGLSRGEGIVEMSFKAFGVVYTVSVECAHVEDARCNENAYALEIADGLVFAANGS